MPVTKEQAMTAREFHYGNCTCSVGPRGGRTVKIETWRRNGQTKTWKRDTSRFEVPIKYGMYAFGYLTQDNAANFHTAEECPLLQQACKRCGKSTGPAFGMCSDCIAEQDKEATR